jgi:hypothetical protein
MALSPAKLVSPAHAVLLGAVCQLWSWCRCRRSPVHHSCSALVLRHDDLFGARVWKMCLPCPVVAVRTYLPVVVEIVVGADVKISTNPICVPSGRDLFCVGDAKGCNPACSCIPIEKDDFYSAHLRGDKRDDRDTLRVRAFVLQRGSPNLEGLRRRGSDRGGPIFPDLL